MDAEEFTASTEVGKVRFDIVRLKAKPIIIQKNSLAMPEIIFPIDHVIDINKGYAPAVKQSSSFEHLRFMMPVVICVTKVQPNQT